jgi:hypothetical protein
VIRNLDSYVKWPKRAELLWDGCNRKLDADRKRKYHSCPPALKLALGKNCRWDGRSNGPAVVSYRVAGGERPLKAVGDGWSIHHLYDGQFPFPGNHRPSLTAAREGRHFTQSAGLVAVHPIADALAHEFSAFAWRLRAGSFERFGYDPEGVFSDSPDAFGFAGGECGRVWYSAL